MQSEQSQARPALQTPGWSIRQLDALSQIPDTGAALDEIERNRRRNAYLRNLNNAFRLGRRPRIAADITIEGIRAIARSEVEKLRQDERAIAQRLHGASRRLQDIAADRRNAERLLETARKRARQEGCDPDFVNHFCG